jgi:hypothetical protein
MQRQSETIATISKGNAEIAKLKSSLGVYGPAKIGKQPLEILGEAGLKVLHKGCETDANIKYDARKKFLDYLQSPKAQDKFKKRMNELVSPGQNKSPIT